MYAVEFETHIVDGIVHIPEKYKSLDSVDAKVIILTNKPKSPKLFNPKEFFGRAKSTKKEIDEYLNAIK